MKIIRAEKLISGLGGEKERWTQVCISRGWSGNKCSSMLRITTGKCRVSNKDDILFILDK